MFLWDNEKMIGCLRVDIMKGKYFLIFIDNIGWDLFISNFAEYTAHKKPP
jgi:hypothetical protein